MAASSALAALAATPEATPLAALAATPEATPQEGLMPSDADCQGKLFLLILGNPGAGKSTLQSLYAKQAVFTVGLGSVGGQTTIAQFHPAPNTPEFKDAHIIQVDTPGLDDAMKREQCCQQVVNALRVCGQKQLVFVLKADELRINASEFKLIHLVLDALSPEIRGQVARKFGIIVNKLTECIFEQTEEAKELKGRIVDMVKTSFPELPLKNITLQPYNPDLRAKKHAAFAKLLEESAVSMDPQLKHWINNLDAITVPREYVNDIQVDEQKLKQLEEELEKVDADYQAKTATMTEEHKAELRKLAEDQEASWAKFATVSAETARDVVVPIVKAAAPVVALTAEAVLKGVIKVL